MADGTPVTYEDLTDELKKKYDKVKTILEADLIGSVRRTPLTWYSRNGLGLSRPRTSKLTPLGKKTSRG
ncbi:hypothetical protein QYE76_035815 [Lolium multiflorum]|uniref:Uncharacterized protein n=1 Tax=Lolium multiflorum TaxID=4521 RepID=A0AAD8R0T9_LOLMU|nr:hypothetical protein QYE76_035815 [Lolium multiflorum]